LRSALPRLVVEKIGAFLRKEAAHRQNVSKRDGIQFHLAFLQPATGVLQQVASLSPC